MKQDTPGPVPAMPRQRPVPPLAFRKLSSGELFGATREVRIVHRGVEYRLSQTRQGKLILTK